MTLVMDAATAVKLAKLNTRFYASQADSFSSTRRASWAGWDAALDAAQLQEAPHSILDVACGNMRFAAFAARRFAGAAISKIAYTGIDNCPALAQGACVGFESDDSVSCQAAAVETTFIQRDIVACLLDDMPLELPAAQLVVCSGFMHHVPKAAARVRLLSQLLGAIEPDGVLVVSFWQFMTDPSIAASARELTAPTLVSLGLTLDDVESGDYILGWQNKPDARRYCHSFTCQEVEGLVTAALKEQDASFETAFFEADGKSGRLNCYLVARRLR